MNNSELANSTTFHLE